MVPSSGISTEFADVLDNRPDAVDKRGNMRPSEDLDNIPLYNSRIIDTYIKLIKRKYGHIDIDDLLNYAGMKPYEVADQGHWFTQTQINLFHERLVQLTRNQDIAREAGRYAASPEAIGVMRQYILGMIGPRKVAEKIAKITRNFTQSTTFEYRSIDSNTVEIIVIPKKGIRERPFQCENRIGYFEAIAIIFNSKRPRIEHPECVFKGDRHCRYIISWEKTRSDLWKKISSVSTLILFLCCSVFLIHDPFSSFKTIIPYSAATSFMLFLISQKIHEKDLKNSLEYQMVSADKLVEQININYNNALVTNEIGQAISRHTTVKDILTSVIKISQNRLDYDRGIIMLADRKKNRLIYRAGFGYGDYHLRLLKQTRFHLDKPDSKGVFVVSFREQKPFLINNISGIKADLSDRSMEFAKILGSQSFICCPIVCEGESIGIFALDNIRSKRVLVQSDVSLMMGISTSIAISIRNADLLEARSQQFKSFVRVLAASIDARDPLTAGHSEKVTEYAVGICRELGLSNDDTETIRVAALLHDYGKIAIPDSILKKKGLLTKEERITIETHAARTREILEQVNFQGVLSQVPEIAGSHHEKLDGSGYPCGLKGADIPLGARIIAVADIFEAITSKRHYRDPMLLDEAFGVLENECNVSHRLDKTIVEAFRKYFTRSFEQNLVKSILPETDSQSPPSIRQKTASI